MLGTLGKRLFGTANDRYIKRLAKTVEEINALEPELEALSDTDLAARTPWFRERLEAGESLGFLPGDIQEKVDPYLRPLYDALRDMIPGDQLAKLMQVGTLEIAPLAFMRGRTLNKAFVILDEAQNTTRQQMRMFLTRLGFESRTVVTGDITQVDLPSGQVSGLEEARRLLSNVPGIAFCTFSEVDVVRLDAANALRDTLRVLCGACCTQSGEAGGVARLRQVIHPMLSTAPKPQRMRQY